MKKILKWLSKLLGDCQCDCHDIGYSSCGECRENHPRVEYKLT